jgi:Tfp pilus assembly protein PilO
MNELYKRLSEIPQKRRGMVALFIAMIAALAWYFLSIEPLNAKIIGEQQTIRSIRQKLLQRPKTLERIANLEADIETQKNRKMRLSEQLPDQADIAKLLKKIHERARDTELNITRFENGSTVILELYAKIEVKMEFLGTYTQILSFINELSDVKELDRIINIEQLILSRLTGNEKSSKLRGSFLLVTFMSKSNLTSASEKQ